MREISYTTRFKRDYRRETSARHGKKLDAMLMGVVNLLANNIPLPGRNFDHSLSGEWSDHRDCHIRPDLILIYRKPDTTTLELVRLGSHSELAFEPSYPRATWGFARPNCQPLFSVTALTRIPKILASSTFQSTSFRIAAAKIPFIVRPAPAILLILNRLARVFPRGGPFVFSERNLETCQTVQNAALLSAKPGNWPSKPVK